MKLHLPLISAHLHPPWSTPDTTSSESSIRRETMGALHARPAQLCLLLGLPPAERSPAGRNQPTEVCSFR